MRTILALTQEKLLLAVGSGDGQVLVSRGHRTRYPACSRRADGSGCPPHLQWHSALGETVLTARGISGERPEVGLDHGDIAPGEGTCENVAEFEPGYICGRGEEERGQGFAPEVIWQACECPEPDGGAGECDDLVADEGGGGMVERAIDTFETERLRAKDGHHSLQ